MRQAQTTLVAFISLLFGSGAASAQTAALSLAQAQEMAIRNHPGLAAAALSAQSGESLIKEARAAYFPTLNANITAAAAESGATLSAGAITTSSLYTRAATGVIATQLVSDFGRTGKLAESAKLRSDALGRNVESTRAQLLLEVQVAYYEALAAQSVLAVSQQTLELRRLTLRQVDALAQSGLRSTVDVSFAQVNVSEAELVLSRAESGAQASHARLAAALGYERDQSFTLSDEPLPQPLSSDAQALIDHALQSRPDLAAFRLNHDALERFAEAEGRLKAPTISAVAVAGVAPWRDERLRESYSAASVNVSVPVLNGGLLGARSAEAALHAASAGKSAQEMAVQIARDVRVAWLAASDAFRRLDVTARLVAQADEAVRLARARYDNGLGSIVELNQGEVNQSEAQRIAASAKYDYLIAIAALNYAAGFTQ
jgi:outer membrane protein